MKSKTTKRDRVEILEAFMEAGEVHVNIRCDCENCNLVARKVAILLTEWFRPGGPNNPLVLPLSKIKVLRWTVTRSTPPRDLRRRFLTLRPDNSLIRLGRRDILETVF